MENQFKAEFEELTGHAPFPWQQGLFDLMVKGTEFIPRRCDIPTGLGKTATIAVWILARRVNPQLPRRLVYIVNRRTVVDQTTDEVVRYREALKKQGYELAISTLRGQFADNREWSSDPSREAVICGTVDMIGSRLLFGGYGIGFRSRPLHAGFLGQDALIIHDEAHLEPAFQDLLVAIENEQRNGRFPDYRPLRVMELSATSRGDANDTPLELTQAEKEATRKSPGGLSDVGRRIRAAKQLHLEPLENPKKLAEQLATRALEFQDEHRAVLVFARTVEDVMKIRSKLPEGRVETLTGTMRGKERDQLVDKAIFQRFLPGGQSDDQTTYLVCTSAGEVGVNISADHLVCDLSTFESMAQRFGRVNRFGLRDDSKIHVIHPTEKDFNEKDEYDQRRRKTLGLLNELSGDASPAAIGKLDATRRVAAFAPTQTILPTSDFLFDAWALTTIRGKLPGRPEVEPYLHGLPTEWQPPETFVAWREEVAKITGDLLKRYSPQDLLDEYPLKPHEILRERFDRVHKELTNIAKRWQGDVWLLDDDGNVESPIELAELVKGDKERLQWKTVLLPPSAGGLSTSGMLDGNALPPSQGSLDIADEWFLKDASGELVQQRKRIWNDDSETDSMHEVLTIRLPGEQDDQEERIWRWLRVFNEGELSTQRPVLWDVHVGDVERELAKIISSLPLNDELRSALSLAAKYHDHGKQRALFQRVLGNIDPNLWLAKSGRMGNAIQEKYRHEFGSLLDIEKDLESLNLGEHQDLVLHLIAAHHGYARPHFPAAEACDPERSQSDAERVACEVPRRFARLQRKYGRWGLAYLESLLRAADWAASANPSACHQEGR